MAALMVLFFHMQSQWALVPLLSLVSGVTKWGFAGVDIFFVLSGFVVYRSAQSSIPAQSIWHFARRRLLRIYLGYWPVLLLIAALTLLVYQEPLPPLKKMVFSALLVYPTPADNWLWTAWSLSMEIYFYLWIGLIALLPQRLHLKAVMCVIALLTLWGLGWLHMAPATVYTGQQPLRYGLTGLGIEFLAGAVVAHVYTRKTSLFRRTHALVPGAIAFILFGFWWGTTSAAYANVEILRAFSFGMTGLGALLLALLLEQASWTPPRVLVSVGNASYSLYLLHVPMLSASERFRISYGLGSEAVLPFSLLALPVAIVLLSIVWYRCVEKPIMKAVL
ncbi:MAG: acyltransferase [Gammaproteobacteria bacterium]|nr:acyltransferase [Gammaproteobacteria bacterium]MBU0892358.1 acyltransferase [Gammaproteobacteria bacterium]